MQTTFVWWEKKRNTIVEHLNALRTPNSIVALLQDSCTLSGITSTAWEFDELMNLAVDENGRVFDALNFRCNIIKVIFI